MSIKRTIEVNAINGNDDEKEEGVGEEEYSDHVSREGDFPIYLSKTLNKIQKLLFTSIFEDELLCMQDPGYRA